MRNGLYADVVIRTDCGKWLAIIVSARRTDRSVWKRHTIVVVDDAVRDGGLEVVCVYFLHTTASAEGRALHSNRGDVRAGVWEGVCRVKETDTWGIGAVPLGTHGCARSTIPEAPSGCRSAASDVSTTRSMTEASTAPLVTKYSVCGHPRGHLGDERDSKSSTSGTVTKTGATVDAYIQSAAAPQ